MNTTRLPHLLFAALLASALMACAPAQVQETVATSVDDVQEPVEDAIADPIEDAQRDITNVTTGAVVAVQEVVQEILPPAPPAEPRMPAAATRLIVRWEISSPAHYTRRLQMPVWPGGASGVTWGIGYDGGHQTASTIRSDWAGHASVARLATTAGVTGTPARALARSLRDVLTPYDQAEAVFTASTLPRYHAAAARALGDGFHLLGDNPQGALDSLGYNRGWSMLGPNRREMRHIRDVCVPSGDAACIATQLRSMKRIWPGDRAPGPGLRARREDEAVTAETPA